MTFDTENEIDGMPEVDDAELNPAVAELLAAVQQQEEKSHAGFQELRTAVAQLAAALAEQAKNAATAAAMKAAAEQPVADEPFVPETTEFTPPETPQQPSDELPPMDELPPAVAAVPTPVATPVAAPVAAPAHDTSWDQILLGNELASDPNLAVYRQSLVSGLSNGDAAATGLIGHLLMFRSLPADKMPKVLKEVGEAYYRWSPNTLQGDPMRDAVIQWLERVCEACGVLNKIRVVQVGDRFDSTRHNAKERGIEISDVFGWIVLRDNGKVYSKAIVAVK